MRNFLIRFWKHNPKPLGILNLYEGCPYRIRPHVCIWLYLCMYFGEGNTHSSIPAWRIPRTEQPGGLQSMVWQESDMTEGLMHTCVHIWGFPGGTGGKKKKKYPPANAGDVRDLGSIPGSGRSLGGGHGNPLQNSCLENFMDRGAWWATIHRVAKSRTRLKWLSKHACMYLGIFLKYNGECSHVYPKCGLCVIAI